MNGWIGVDLDGTLAEYHGWQGCSNIGAPVPAMVERVKRWLGEGKTVRILTARVSHDGTWGRRCDALQAEAAIRDWCLKHVGQALDVTCIKDYAMVELWDDRCVQVIPNTGERVDGRIA